MVPDNKIKIDFGDIDYSSGTSTSIPTEYNEIELKKKIRDIEEQVKTLEKDLKDQNIKLIEFLGIFTAILAFITISGKIVIDNLNLFEIIILIPVFALCLLLFVLGIDQLIKKDNKRLFKWTIISLILLLAVALVIAMLIKNYIWIGINI